ncbi:hypothetical protein ABG79_00599 [Caloramator mitchellensis]|uniref:Uncharacterized protein n=1 Tax=Caloramator mitchellensis TaxID=908809 RepID=A0A0R3K4C8_CALMK|nr:hypothetical protein [Caloramator mitchellensis]KRQ87794.1 hypothetical protein ABG79_00599 [Caloramator mitchellensis]
MGEDIKREGLIFKYDSFKVLCESELTPIIDVLLKLSHISVNFANTASIIKNITINETHEVKEFLDIVFDIRKLADKLEDVVEDRMDIVIKLIKCGFFDAQNILTGIEELKEDKK